MLQYILFDLGFVLVELNGMPWFREQSPELCDLEIHRRWLALDSVTDFETGKIQEAEFFEKAIIDLNIKLNPQEFRKIYLEWVVGEYPQANNLVLQLKKKYRVGCLSNTNPAHIQRLTEMGELLENLDDRFYSHELGHMKPKDESYLSVIEQIDLPPKSILFIDDSEDNVNAARSLGMRAEQAKGFEALIQALNKHLPDDYSSPKPA